MFSCHAGQLPTTLTPALEARILEWSVKRKPTDSSTHWSTRKLADRLGISHMMVARVWRKHALRPHRLEAILPRTIRTSRPKPRRSSACTCIRRSMRRCSASIEKSAFQALTAMSRCWRSPRAAPSCTSSCTVQRTTGFAVRLRSIPSHRCRPRYDLPLGTLGTVRRCSPSAEARPINALQPDPRDRSIPRPPEEPTGQNSGNASDVSTCASVPRFHLAQLSIRACLTSCAPMSQPPTSVAPRRAPGSDSDLSRVLTTRIHPLQSGFNAGPARTTSIRNNTVPQVVSPNSATETIRNASTSAGTTTTQTRAHQSPDDATVGEVEIESRAVAAVLIPLRGKSAAEPWST